MSQDRHDSSTPEGSPQQLEQQAKEQEERVDEDGEEEGEVVSRKDGEDEQCKTPTSSDHKIPTIQSCPPTPKKKVRGNRHKRKLSELQFFENTRSEEVESFFRSNSEPLTVNSDRSIKRRCRSA